MRFFGIFDFQEFLVILFKNHHFPKKIFSGVDEEKNFFGSCDVKKFFGSSGVFGNSSARHMHDPVLDFLGTSLIPELCANVAAGSASYRHFTLVSVPAVWALPYQFSRTILYDFNLPIISAVLTIVTLGIQFRIHNVFINKFHHRQDRRNVIL